MSDWHTEPLDECLEALLDYRGKSPPKSGKGVPVLSAKVVKTTGLVRPIEQKIAIDYYPKWMVRGLPRVGDVVMTTEAPMGEVIQLDAETVRYALGQRIVCMRGKPQKLDNTFLRYLLISPAQQAKLSSYATGTTVLGISQKALRSVPVSYPRFDEQKRIGELLGALDDKIELNRLMNETLEAMARAIFKDWFVDFGPTRAKMEGRPPYLAPDIWSLFPDRLDDEGKPEGWDFGLIGDLGEIAIGGLWGNDEPQSNDEIAYACLRGVDLQNLREQGVASKAPVRYGAKRALASRSIGPRDVLIASSGAGPCGRSLWVGDPGFFEKKPTTYSNFVKRIACISEPAACYIDRLLFEMRQSGEIAQFIVGTSVPNLNDRALLGNHRIILPAEPLIARFYDFSLTVQKHLYSGENETLAATRDLLLPKLMSGEVRVRDAAKHSGQAT